MATIERNNDGGWSIHQPLETVQTVPCHPSWGPGTTVVIVARHVPCAPITGVSGPMLRRQYYVARVYGDSPQHWNKAASGKEAQAFARDLAAEAVIASPHAV